MVFRAALLLTTALLFAVIALFVHSAALASAAPESDTANVIDDSPPDPVRLTRPNIFYVLWRATGIIFGPLLLALAIAQLGLLIWFTFELRRSAGVAPVLAVAVRKLTGNQPDKAIELAAVEPTAFARFLGVGLLKLPMGYSAMRRAMDNKLDELRAYWQTRLVVVLLTGIPGPLSGIVLLLYSVFSSFLYYGAFVDPIQARIFMSPICSGSAVLLIGSIEAASAVVGYLLLKSQMNWVLIVARNAADELLTDLSKSST